MCMATYKQKSTKVINEFLKGSAIRAFPVREKKAFGYKPKDIAHWDKPHDGYGLMPMSDDIIILDMDTREGGREILERIKAAGGCRMVVLTKDGYHFYLDNPDHLRPSKQVRGYKGEWIKYNSGPWYAVGPGSQHPEGGMYKLLREHSTVDGATASDFRDLMVVDNITRVNKRFEEERDETAKGSIVRYLKSLGCKTGTGASESEWKGQCPAGAGYIKTSSPNCGEAGDDRFWVHSNRQTGYIGCHLCPIEAVREVRLHIFEELRLHYDDVTPCGPEDDSFWAKTEFLSDMRERCLKRGVDPVSSLLHLLSRMSAISYPLMLKVPGKRSCPLNLYTVVIGPSSAGKSDSAEAVDEELFKWPKLPRRPIPVTKFDPFDANLYRKMQKVDPVSKQGLYDTFLIYGKTVENVGMEIKSKGRAGHFYFPGAMVFMDIDEGFGTIVEGWERTGNQALGLIKTAYKGAALSISNSQREMKARPEIEAKTYSFGVSVRGTLEEMIQLLQNQSGLSQRLMYAYTDVELWEIYFKDTKVKKMPVPDVSEIKEIVISKKVVASWDQHQKRVRREIRRMESEYMAADKEASVDHLDMRYDDGHTMLMALKIASLLSLFETKSPGHVKMRHWEAALRLIKVRSLTVEKLRHLMKTDLARRDVRSAKREAARERVKEKTLVKLSVEEKREEVEKRVVNKLLSKRPKTRKDSAQRVVKTPWLDTLYGKLELTKDQYPYKDLREKTWTLYQKEKDK